MDAAAAMLVEAVLLHINPNAAAGPRPRADRPTAPSQGLRAAHQVDGGRLRYRRLVRPRLDQRQQVLALKECRGGETGCDGGGSRAVWSTGGKEATPRIGPPDTGHSQLAAVVKD
jgi:hypothetical protein